MTNRTEPIDLDAVRIDPSVAFKVPAAMAMRRKVLPFARSEFFIHVACADVGDLAALQAVEKALGAPIKAEPAEPESLVRALDRVYGDGNSSGSGDSRIRPRSVDGDSRIRPRSIDARSLEAPPSEAVSLGEEILQSAILRQASDVHLEPGPMGTTVRFRVDGILDVHRIVPAAAATGLVSRFKVLAGLDIAEKRAPQDGSFKHKYGRGSQSVDIRAATLPTKYGERMTLRLLALRTESLTLEKLGMNERDLALFERAIDYPHGMILLTGPTGSGKSTTLYAAVRRLLNRESLNIITVEDPIEYEMSGVSQVEVDSADKVSFVKALRSVLRHDPDVVMIGEIRDGDTADVAIKASLTGHLVLSTLHTNTAAGAVTRLLDMGVERHLVAATLRLAAAQRLVRRVCPRCATARLLTEKEAAALGHPELAGREVKEPVGCVYCGGRGCSGRIGLFELFPVDEPISRRIATGVDEVSLIGDCRFPRLADDGLEKLLSGVAAPRDVVAAVNVW